MGQTFYKKIYSIRELYAALYKGFRTMRHLAACRKSKVLETDFIERIMLAVTEVNGCVICSYAHTKIALEHGMPSGEIQSILSGSMESIPEGETVAILFAQHYADTRGEPSSSAWLRVVNEYGLKKSLGILGVVRAIMIGNVSGIAFSAFLSRLKAKPVQKSSIPYELGMLLSLVLFVPAALIHGMISNLFRVPLIRFRETN